MTSEAPPTTPAAEPAPQEPVTESQPTNPEQLKPEPDWKAAYVGLQRTVNKAHARNEELLRQNAALADATGGLKEDVDVLLRQTVGEEEFGKRVISRAQTQERQAAFQAAQAGQAFIHAQTSLFLETLQASGVDPNDPSIDWARDASNVQEWRERVGPSIVARMQRANEERISAYESSLKAKTAKEVEVEAEALTEQQLKAAGVDRIDTAKGGGRTTFVDRVRTMDRESPEFARMMSDAKAGRLRT